MPTGSPSTPLQARGPVPDPAVIEVDIDLTRVVPRAAPRLAPSNPVHSSEIAIRQLPTAWRGYETAAVRSWLALVALAHSMLEDDAARSRASWDNSLRAIAHLRARIDRHSSGDDGIFFDATDELRRATKALRQARRPLAESDHETLAVRRAVLETPLPRRLLGVHRASARGALDSAAAQLARLENRAAVLEADNENLRDLLLEVVGDVDST